MGAFIAGATGYTGHHLVRALRRRGVAVVAHVRPDSPDLEQRRKYFSELGAEVDTTPWLAQPLTDTIRRMRPTHVFAVLGTTRARARTAERRGVDASYEAVDYGLSALLLQATIKAAPAACFVYLSSLGVNAQTRNPYLAVRSRLETELKNSGLRYIIARPSFITGADREDFRPLERVAATLADGVLRVLARLGAHGLRARFTAMTGQQLAEALAEAALNGKYRDVVLETPELRELASR